MSDEVLTGSCLCGAVSYEVRGPFTRFGHCHCSRCRKASGSAHSTALYAIPANDLLSDLRSSASAPHAERSRDDRAGGLARRRAEWPARQARPLAVARGVVVR